MIKDCFKGSYAGTEFFIGSVFRRTRATNTAKKCLSRVSFMDLSCGWSMGVEGRECLWECLQKMKLKHFHLCMCFAQNSAMQHAKL